MEVRLHPAVSIISLIVTPLTLAAETDAALVEWALKLSVSTPARDSIPFTHLAMVAEVTAL